MQDNINDFTDDDIAGIIVAAIKKEVAKIVNKGCDFVVGKVLSVNPLKIKIGDLELDSEFVKKLRNVIVEKGNTVLLGKQNGGQKYYILGVID